MREIEIKLRVDNLDELEEKLTDSGLVISKEITQHDVIYSKNGSSIFTSFREGDVVIRIRKQDGVAILNLKQQKSGEMDNLEYETEVVDADATHQILLKLGWAPEVEVKKVRKKGKLGEYEVCLDNVEKLGTFVELEKMTDDKADPQQIREELFKELEKFGLLRKDEETRGYDTQIYQLKNN